MFGKIHMRYALRCGVLVLVLLCGVGCKSFQKFLHDDEAVARVGDYVLYRAEVEAVVPNGIPAADSAALARRYIDTWASGKVYLLKAEEQLSKSELDVTREMEDYREALLKFRYEQHYVNSHLDTLVSENEISAYYDAHKDDFILQRPLVKARYVNLLPDSPSLGLIRRNFTSEKPEDITLVDSLAATTAIKYLDLTREWVDVTTVSGEFGIDWKALMDSRKNGVAEAKDSHGNICLAFIPEEIQAGDPAPVEYCERQIRDIILSSRKHDLVRTLERDLLYDASVKGNYEIFENENSSE